MANSAAIGAVREQFQQRYGTSPDWIVAAPGRVNLIGEHTDHNGGFVLPMAIDRQTVIAASRNEESRDALIDAYSMNLDESDRFPGAAYQLTPGGRWTDYVKGVLAEYVARGLAPPSLNVVVWSDVPIGCGLSSSAALQIAAATLLQQLQPGVVSDAEIPALCQTAEHRFTGVPVGIMDQFCIAQARKGRLVFLDCRSLHAEHVPFEDPDVAILIVNSRVSRELRSGAYAARRAECTRACEVLAIDELRDANEASIEAAREALGDVCYRRARHVTSENARTEQAVAAIREQDWPQFGELMYASHRSMAEDFEMSCDELDLLVELARDIGAVGGVHGSRMTGGGFGGCTVSLIERKSAKSITETLREGYRRETGIELEAYLSSPAQGARVLETGDA